MQEVEQPVSHKRQEQQHQPGDYDRLPYQPPFGTMDTGGEHPKYGSRLDGAYRDEQEHERG